jgi:hypothetical protein
MPILISNLRPSSIVSISPLIVPAGENIQFTVIGQWDLSPSYCVFGTVLRRSRHAASNKIWCDFEFSHAPETSYLSLYDERFPSTGIAQIQAVTNFIIHSAIQISAGSPSKTVVQLDGFNFAFYPIHLISIKYVSVNY